MHRQYLSLNMVNLVIFAIFVGCSGLFGGLFRLQPSLLNLLCNFLPLLRCDSFPIKHRDLTKLDQDLNAVVILASKGGITEHKCLVGKQSHGRRIPTGVTCKVFRDKRNSRRETFDGACVISRATEGTRRTLSAGASASAAMSSGEATPDVAKESFDSDVSLLQSHEAREVIGLESRLICRSRGSTNNKMKQSINQLINQSINQLCDQEKAVRHSTMHSAECRPTTAQEALTNSTPARLSKSSKDSIAFPSYTGQRETHPQSSQAERAGGCGDVS